MFDYFLAVGSTKCRMAQGFLYRGLPEFLALVVRFTITEPERGISENKQDQKDNKPSVKETFRYLLSKPAFVQISIANSLAAFVGYGVITWYPAFLIRTHELGTAEIGLWLGLIMGLVGGAGMYLGGFLSDKFGSRDTRWYLWTPGVILVATVPFGIAGYIAENLVLVLMWFAPTILAGNFWQATSLRRCKPCSNLGCEAWHQPSFFNQHNWSRVWTVGRHSKRRSATNL